LGGTRTRTVSLNKYLYTEGNPVSYVDPSGKFLVSLTTAATKIGKFYAKHALLVTTALRGLSNFGISLFVGNSFGETIIDGIIGTVAGFAGGVLLKPFTALIAKYITFESILVARFLAASLFTGAVSACNSETDNIWTIYEERG